MGYVATALITALLFVGCAFPKPTPPPEGTLKTLGGGLISIEDFESGVTGSMQKAGVTGLSAAILNEGRVVYTGHFGWRDKDEGTTLNDTTVFPAASLSKPVFAYLVMVLAAEGLIDLDRPLQDYLEKQLPEYPRYADLAGDTRYRAITARMALGHATGLPNLRSETEDGRLRIQLEPGRRFSYSGEGIQLLQMVVETVSRSDLETLARRRVFVPFGMSHTSFVWREAFARNAAAPHNEFEWPADPNRPVSADAAGSLTTTAHDYALFIQGMLKDEQNVTRMLAPVVRIRSPRMFGPGSRTESGANDAIRLSWGHGVGLFETPYGPAFFHTGNLAGAKNYTVVYPEQGIGIVLLSNSDNFQSVAREIVAAGIGDNYSPFGWLGYVPFDQVTRRPPPPRRVPIQVAADVIAPYAGKYQTDDGRLVVFIKTDGARLYVSEDGDSWDEAYAESETRFFFKGRDLTLEFQKDTGIVTRIEIFLNATVIRARRIE